MRFRIITPAAAVLVIAWGSIAAAGEVVITQKSKKFDNTAVTIKKGGSIRFVNADTVSHSVYSDSPGAKFDLGVQKPGTSSSYIFAKDGTFKVRCIIHSRMKVTVTVN